MTFFDCTTYLQNEYLSPSVAGSKVPSKSRNISSGSAEALGGPSCAEGSSTFSEKDSQLNTSSPTR